MKKSAVVLFLFFIYCSVVFAQHYNDFFNDKACRVDFHFCGNAQQTNIFLDKVKQEPFWGGRRGHLSNNLNLGDYRFRVLDSISHQQIYLDGFSSLYHEWQTSPEALTTNKSFEQTIQFPFPRKAVTLIIEKRTDLDHWSELFRYKLSPTDKLIQHINPKVVPVKIISKNAAPDKAIDIAVIAEGYTAKEQRKFYRDAQRLAENLLTHEPFTKYKSRINIYAVAATSEESGISLSTDSVWKNTAVGSHFYTFYEPRYLTTLNTFKVRDLAALVPYDAIYVLANTTTYGGGGIYNFYALTAAGNKLSTQVTVHEFGHSFAGLADEYFYEKQDALDGMYDIKKEPWEPNITSLVQFDRKWKNKIPEGTPIPTPPTEENKTKIGIFEGGGYLTKGMYRPMFDCRMRTNQAPEFCPVCQQAVERMILFLTE
ncbi:MAG: M64 family metallopeptidase [Bacteroidota bacterium]|nr:M64 family metallopeptidase [Bacteroidota bacterium]